jgi:hypothetical protein
MHEESHEWGLGCETSSHTGSLSGLIDVGRIPHIDTILGPVEWIRGHALLIQ